jgi:hypothetical protein
MGRTDFQQQTGLYGNVAKPEKYSGSQVSPDAMRKYAIFVR